MAASATSFLFFILKSVLIIISLFFLWQAFRKRAKKTTALLFLAMLGAATFAGFLIITNPLLTRSYFEGETQNGEDPPIHFTGDAPGEVPLAMGQAEFLHSAQILTSILGLFLALSIGAFIFKDATTSFQISCLGLCCLVIGATFL